MKHFFSRVFSMHPFLLSAAFLLLPPASVLLWREAFIAPGSTERAINLQGDKTRTAVLDWMTTHVAPVVEGNPMASNPLDRLSLRALAFAEVDRQATGLQAQIVGVRSELFDRVDQIHDSLFTVATAGLSEIDQARKDANVQLAALNLTARSTGMSAANLMDTYAALPDRLQTSATWQALQPEFTCRNLDGTGYGGCWHGRITALLGEGAKVGGTFTQKFPALADGIAGMATDGHQMTAYAQRWMAKNVDPHPMTKREKLGAAVKLSITLLVAALRGGVI